MCPYTLLYPPSRHPSFSFTRDSSKDQSLGGFAYGKYGEPGNFGTGYWGRKILGGMTASYLAFPPKSEWNDTFLSAIHLLQYRQVKSLFCSQISDCTKKSKKICLAKNTEWKTFVYMFAYSFSNNLFNWKLGASTIGFLSWIGWSSMKLWEVTWVPTCSTYPELRIQDPAERKLKLTTELNNGRLVPRVDGNCFRLYKVDTSGRYNTTRNSNEQQATTSNNKQQQATTSSNKQQQQQQQQEEEEEENTAKTCDWPTIKAWWMRFGRHAVQRLHKW